MGGRIMYKVYQMSELEHNVFYGISNLAHQARNYPGVFETVIEQERNERLQRTNYLPDMYTMSLPDEDKMKIYREKLLNNAYKLLFPSEDPHLISYQQKKKCN